jgi:putative ABC transport system ATP-binding protein
MKQEKKKNSIIQAKNVKKSFTVGNQDVLVLKGVNFDIAEGDFVVVFGPSGCGKSTLLHCILGLEAPTEGEINFFNNDLYKDSTEDDRALIRKRYVGMVYQQPNWIKALNVIGNVAFPLTLLGIQKSEAHRRAVFTLRGVGMEAWAEYIPTELSSGQQQRIALARALIHDPQLIVADEPTGNLDYGAGQSLMRLLAQMNKDQNKTIIMVTHDLEYMKYAKRVIQMFDGNVVKIHEDISKKDLMKTLQFKRGVNQQEE